MAKKALFVLGMHRGGTSALAGALTHAGLNPGRTLLAPNVLNPEGYWESEAVVRLNDRLLATAGRLWDSLSPPPADWLDGPEIASLLAESVTIVRNEFLGASEVVVKDPRLCLTLPFWIQAFAAQGFDAASALILRRPSEVAVSLALRDGFAQPKALALWLAYLVHAERVSRNMPRILVSYDALLADATAVVGTVIAATRVPVLLDNAKCERVHGFVRGDLKHARSDAVRSEGDPANLARTLDAGYENLISLPFDADICPAVAALEARARRPLERELPEWIASELDRARNDVLTLSTEIDCARAAHATRDAVEADLRARVNELVISRSDLAHVSELTARIDAQIAQAGTQLAKLVGAQSEANQVESKLRVELGKLREDRDRANADLQAARNELDAALETGRRSSEEIEQARKWSLDQTRQLNVAREHVDGLVAEIERARESHRARDQRERELESRCAALSAERETVIRDQEDFRATLAALRKQLEVHDNLIATTTAERVHWLAEVQAGALRIGALERELSRQVAERNAAFDELAALNRRWIVRAASKLWKQG